ARNRHEPRDRAVEHGGVGPSRTGNPRGSPTAEDEREERAEYAEDERDQPELVPAREALADLVRAERDRRQTEHQQQGQRRKPADADPAPEHVTGPKHV